jgi:septum formation protein
MKQPLQIYLASQSPRRRELLQQVGVNFEVLRVDVDETMQAGEDPVVYAERLALEKARAGREARVADSGLPVLGADTIVVASGTVLGKPADRQQAIEMLQLLSGSTHQVISAVAVAGDREVVAASVSRVTFRTLTRRECEAYWETGEPQDKAGAYAIQGLAAMFITRLEGSYSGVMGLPLHETTILLNEFGIQVI